jgi:hypothetical protein
VLGDGFYRPQQRAPRVTSSLQFGLVSVKRREGEGCWGWSRATGNLERLPEHQDMESTGIQKGAKGRACDGFTSVLWPGFGEGR